MPCYIVRLNEKREYCVELRDPQGAFLLDCMRFVDKASALTAVTNVRALAPFESRYLRMDPRALPNSFVMRDYRERLVAAGAEQPDIPAREATIAACRRFGPTAKLRDQTGDSGEPARV